MLRFLEIILGLPRGFLSQQGSFTIQFNPTWPFQQYVGGAAVWNAVLIAAAVALVVYVYRREARSRAIRIGLGILRGAIIGLVILLLNRPVLTLGQERVEPSVLAVLVDDSASMKIQDAGATTRPVSRLDAAVDLLTGQDAELLRKLEAVHNVRLYTFDRSSRPIASIDKPAAPGAVSPTDTSVDPAVAALKGLNAEGDSTQIVPALQSVLEDLQGQRVAGVVVLTDGRQTPDSASPESIAAVKSFGVKIFPVPIGSQNSPRNIAVEGVDYEPAAFVDDLTNFKITVQASGYEPNHPITLALMRPAAANDPTHLVPVTDAAGHEITKTVEAADDKPFDVDLQYAPTHGDMPEANLVVQATPQPGEFDTDDNFRKIRLDVLDDHVAVLYVDGYPRWDYRFLKTSLLRDKTVKVSTLLTSADPAFRQEGSDDPDRPGQTWAITAFPTSMEQLLDYDVVVFGDVDPRQFTDAQLQMVSDFVSKSGGGFEMVAGPRWSPQAFRNTPIESVLPVIITHVVTDDPKAEYPDTFRPVVTPAGMESSIFRFFPDPAVNAAYLRDQWPGIFWYCRGVMVKPGAGIVYAEHPTDLGPDNRKAPLLVAGRFGAGRTFFSGIDDSWRWRYYTGESIFNTYWVEQLRYLARGRKLGERKLSFTSDNSSYELGKQIALQVRVLSPDLMRQISPPIVAHLSDDATGQEIRTVELAPQEGSQDTYTGSFIADRIGQFTATLPAVGDGKTTLSLKVETPRLELAQPQVDSAFLSRLTADGPIPFDKAATKLAGIESAARIVPVETPQPLWNAPLALIVFCVLITLEWVLRKMFGML